MSQDLLVGDVRPRVHAGADFLWLCWDALIRIDTLEGEAVASAATSLDGGASVAPLSALGDRPIANLRLAGPVHPNRLRIHGQVLARRLSSARHARPLVLETAEAFSTGPGPLTVESSSSEMLISNAAPVAGAAWRMYFQKRWLAIQHLAVAAPGAIDQADNLLAGGLEGGAAPRLETLEAAYGVRAARGTFVTGNGQVCYRAVELGPLTYDMDFSVSPLGIEAALMRQTSADCLAFAAPLLTFALARPTEATIEGDTLRLSAGQSAAVLRAEPPLKWQLAGPTADLRFDDPVTDLGLFAIEAGRRKGTLRLSFETPR